VWYYLRACWHAYRKTVLMVLAVGVVVGAGVGSCVRRLAGPSPELLAARQRADNAVNDLRRAEGEATRARADLDSARQAQQAAERRATEAEATASDAQQRVDALQQELTRVKDELAKSEARAASAEATIKVEAEKQPARDQAEHALQTIRATWKEVLGQEFPADPAAIRSVLAACREPTSTGGAPQTTLETPAQPAPEKGPAP
jgi:chromosome segregation ATPase